MKLSEVLKKRGFIVYLTENTDLAKSKIYEKPVHSPYELRYNYLHWQGGDLLWKIKYLS